MRELLFLESSPEKHDAPNASPMERAAVRWVRQNKSTLLGKVSLDYLPVKQEEGQDSRR